MERPEIHQILFYPDSISVTFAAFSTGLSIATAGFDSNAIDAISPNTILLPNCG